MKSFVKEARRRRVFRVAAFYIVAAWAALQVADLAFPAVDVAEAAIRYVWIGALIGLPIAVIFGWYYDVTFEGIVKTPPLDPSAEVDLSLHIGDYLTMVALLAVIGLVTFDLVDRILKTPDEPAFSTAVTEAPEYSIAVLPFADMSKDRSNEYFSDGISEELLNRLAQVSTLKVSSRTSSFRFKGRNEPVSVIAAQLGVRTVLEGSVRKAGNKIRVTAQLINAEDGYHLWSQNYDRELGDIFAIQDEIAVKVVDALKVTLLSSDADRLNRHPTDNIEAYQAYLLGRQRMAKRTSTALNEAIGYFEQAIELDTNFALAYVGVADANNLLGTWGNLTIDEVLANAEPALARALQLDDQLGEAHAALGYVLDRKRDYEGAAAAYKKAIELNPSYADVYHRYGNLMKWQFGRIDEALALHLKALELDPLSTPINMAIAEDYHEMGRYDEAMSQFQRVIEIEPEFPRAYSLVADLYWEVFAEVDEAARWLHKAIELDPGNPNHARWLSMVYLDLGDPESASYWLSEAIKIAPDQGATKWTQLWFAYYGGAQDELLAAAEELLAVAPGHIWGLTVLRNEDLAAGRADLAVKRFQEAYPQLLGSDELILERFDHGPAIEISVALIEAGQNERAHALLYESLTAIQSQPRLGYSGTGISDVEIFALLGDKEKALAQLRQAYDEGWRAAWWMMLKRNRTLASLHDEPAYQEIVARIESEMAAQLARVNAMKANGEIALPGVSPIREAE